MQKKRFYFVALLMVAVAGLALVECNASQGRFHSSLMGLLLSGSDYTLIDGKPKQFRWDEKLSSSKLLSAEYSEAKAWFNQAKQEPIEGDAFWEAVMNRVTLHWLGTGWDYNGTTRTPGEGNIACGYLLTTILEDVGFDLPRAKLAQLPSEKMIRRLVNKKHIRHFLNMDHPTFIQQFKEWGPGVYIIGMDNHTGFLWNDGTELYFIHSSWWPRKSTMKEIALWSPGLADTKYRVVGKLSADEQLFAAWKNGTKVGYASP